jgi:hypothetical protein
MDACVLARAPLRQARRGGGAVAVGLCGARVLRERFRLSNAGVGVRAARAACLASPRRCSVAGAPNGAALKGGASVRRKGDMRTLRAAPTRRFIALHCTEGASLAARFLGSVRPRVEERDVALGGGQCRLF